jgi:hypothetical protein
MCCFSLLLVLLSARLVTFEVGICDLQHGRAYQCREDREAAHTPELCIDPSLFASVVTSPSE